MIFKKLSPEHAILLPSTEDEENEQAVRGNGG
jgi:hypothetical protein